MVRGKAQSRRWGYCAAKSASRFNLSDRGTSEGSRWAIRRSGPCGNMFKVLRVVFASARAARSGVININLAFIQKLLQCMHEVVLCIARVERQLPNTDRNFPPSDHDRHALCEYTVRAYRQAPSRVYFSFPGPSTLFPHSFIVASHNCTPLPQRRATLSHTSPRTTTSRVLRDLMMRILHLRGNCAAVDRKEGISLALVLVRSIPSVNSFQAPLALHDRASSSKSRTRNYSYFANVLSLVSIHNFTLY